MPAELTTLGAQAAIDFLTGRSMLYTATRQMYLGLAIAVISDGTTLATVSEVTTAGYARKPVSWNAPTSATPVVGSNSGVLTFGPFSAAMASPVTYAFLTDASAGTSGNIVMYWALDAPKQAANGETVSVAASALQYSLT